MTARLGRIARGYSFAFSALLAGALLIATLIQDHGGFGLTNQLADVAPLAIAALASAPSIIGGGFDLSISPLIFFTNAVFVVWLAPHGLGGAVSVPIMLGLGVASGMFTGLMIVLLRVQPVVVTLAMYFILQGVDLLFAPNPVSMSHVGWITHLSGTIGRNPRRRVHDRRAAADLVRACATSRSDGLLYAVGATTRRLSQAASTCLPCASRATPSAGCSPASAGWP